MAEFELRLKHTNTATRASLHALALLFPLWGVALPTLLVLFLVILLRLPANLPLLSIIAIVFGLTSVIALATFFAVYCDDDEIRISKDGFSFPLKFFPSLKFQPQLAWKDLARIKLNWHRKDRFSSDEHITLIFRNGGAARLKLSDVATTDLEQFFIAYEACASECDCDAELPDFQYYLQNRNTDSGLLTSTQIWERSLSSRFSTATFVPLEPGSSLQEGYYQILKQLSFGGFNATYMARLKTGAFVTLKEACFPESDELESRARETFSREAAILAKLNHPNVLPVLDYFVENGRHYIVTSYEHATDLQAFVLQHGAQSPQAVLNIAKQLCSALTYLHGQTPPIVHRDIAPENILLKDDGSVILTEFGSAKELQTTFTGTIVGKQSYTAPEQLRGKTTEKSDIYSVGAVLYFLATGNQPAPLTPCNLGAMKPVALTELVAKATDLDEDKRPDAGLLEILVHTCIKTLQMAAPIEKAPHS